MVEPYSKRVRRLVREAVKALPDRSRFMALTDLYDLAKGRFVLPN
ncbi:hypothetical protein ES703_114572 [subsurface metagenome]